VIPFPVTLHSEQLKQLLPLHQGSSQGSGYGGGQHSYKSAKAQAQLTIIIQH